MFNQQKEARIKELLVMLNPIHRLVFKANAEFNEITRTILGNNKATDQQKKQGLSRQKELQNIMTETGKPYGKYFMELERLHASNQLDPINFRF